MNRLLWALVAGVGAPAPCPELRGEDHELWIRLGAENLEKVFLFFDTVSRRTNPGYITEAMLPR